MKIRPAEVDPRHLYRFLIGSVVPRPIAFISTCSAAGILNLAPFSFFNVVCSNPPVLSVSIAYREPKKDTLRNIEDSAEFVVNIVGEHMAEAMNTTSGEYPSEVDEFAVSGLTSIPSEVVRPSRVAESAVQMECRLFQKIVISDRPLGATLVLGEVLLMHVAEQILDGAGFIDPDRLRAIARMGCNTYSRTRDRFDLARPIVK